MNLGERVAGLEIQLNSFNLQERSRALQELLALAVQGEISLPDPGEGLNLHCHTFFSFNAYGHSPTSLAWLARKLGLRLVGMVDFDVLDGVDEFFQANDLVGVPATAGIETRLYIPEFATREMNSPGEPGVAYHMAIGFSYGQAPASAQPSLNQFRQRALHRNLQVIERVNAYLDPVKIDYQRDVVPLTPAGTGTERHIVVAYIQAVENQVADPTLFWSGKLGLDPAKTAELRQNSAGLQNSIRAKLMKRGGPGYVQPTASTFPSLDEFHRIVRACRALPCFAWLDGTTQGEQDISELLDLMLTSGVVVVNIIPDRSWNISDPAIRQDKLTRLYQFVSLAKSLDLPINVGTEMNSFGNRLVDDFSAPEMQPLLQDFKDGAYFVYGHTALERHIHLGYFSAWADAFLPTRQAKNQFYTHAGRLLPPGRPGRKRLNKLQGEMSPQDILLKLGNGD